MRGIALAAGLVVALLGATATVGLTVNVVRPSNDLLVPLTITVALRNPLREPLVVSFLTTDLYSIEVRDEHTQLWSSLFGHSPIDIERRIPFASGSTTLGSFVWDTVTNDGRSLAPGTYTLRVGILGSIVHPTFDEPIVFATPTPVGTVKTLAAGTAVTVSGTPVLANGTVGITDGSETIRLTRGVGPRPQGTYVVRGIVRRGATGVTLDVVRAMPAFDNLDAVASPPPGAPVRLTPLPRLSPLPRQNAAPRSTVP